MKCPKNECMLRGRCCYPTVCAGISVAPPPWTGPKPDEIDAAGRLLLPVPPERWPYGPPSVHESSCMLFDFGGEGEFCDCAASCADDSDFGIAP